MAVGIVLFSAVVTLALTVAQLYLEYRAELGAIKKRFDEIQISYLGSLGSSLWTTNADETLLLVHGILSLPEITYVEVQEIGPAESSVSLSAGSRAANGGMERVYDISAPQGWATSGNEAIGRLIVEADLSDIYYRIEARAIIIMLTQGVQTFFVSTFLLLVFHRTVTRHLMTISGHFRGYDPAMGAKCVTLRRTKPSTEDELDDLVSALNSMSSSIERAAREREWALRKLRQQEASLDRAYRHFTTQETAAKLAHEINQPLACVSTYVQLLHGQIKTGTLNPQDLPVLIERMSREVMRVREIMASNQTPPDAVEFALTPARLGEILEDVRPLLQQICDDNAVSIHIDAPLPGPLVACSATNLQQVMVNLVRNSCEALAANPAGQRDVTLSIRQHANQALFKLADNGPGFPQDIIEAERTLFLSTKNVASGMGLSIAGSILEMHYGKLDIANARQGGALVQFRLPIVAA
ncbi:MAG TPA: ATP-binding protein [Magnetospirillum sp.]|nr:ATP-binding protein [Magnetospirillum sp.]